MALSTERPIFVCGVPKSGTTMVGQLLSNHADLQTDFDIDPSIAFLKYVKANMEDYFFFSEIPGTILADRDKYWKADDFREWHLLNIDYFQRLHLSYRAGATRWGSSSCSTYQHRDMIWNWFPEAIFLIVNRDPRDQWCSFKQLHMREGITNPWNHFVNFRRTVPVGESDPRLRFVEYHEVVDDPTIVFDILGLTVPENYLNGMRDVFIGRTKGNNQQGIEKDLQFGDIITSRVGRWKRDLRMKEIVRCYKEFPNECSYYDTLNT